MYFVNKHEQQTWLYIILYENIYIIKLNNLKDIFYSQTFWFFDCYNRANVIIDVITRYTYCIILQRLLNFIKCFCGANYKTRRNIILNSSKYLLRVRLIINMIVRYTKV